MTGPRRRARNRPAEAARGFEAVIAGGVALRWSIITASRPGGERRVDGADKVAAEPRLFDDERQRAVAERGRLGQDLVGELVKHHCRRRPLGAGHREQGVEIDEACRKRGRPFDTLAEIEREPAFEDLRMTLGVKGEIESRQLGALGCRLDRTFSARSSKPAGARPRPPVLRLPDLPPRLPRHAPAHSCCARRSCRRRLERRRARLRRRRERNSCCCRNRAAST